MRGSQRLVELVHAGVDLVAALVDLFEQVLLGDRLDARHGALLVDDGLCHLVGALRHGRPYLATRHVAHRAALDVQQLAVLLELHLAAALHLDARQHAKLLEQRHILVLDKRRHRVHGRCQVQKPTALGLVEPLVGIPIAVEDDVLVRGQGLAHPGKRRLLEVCGSLDAGVEVLQRLGHRRVQHRVAIREVHLAARHAELELVAREGKRRGAVAVRVVDEEVRQGLDAQVHVGVLGARVLLAVDQRLDHVPQLVAQEDGDDGRRRLVGAQAVVVARTGHRRAQDVLVVVHGLDRGREKHQEAQVAHGGFARVEQVHPVGGNRPVVVLAAAVDALEGLLVLQADQSVVACDGLHQLHHQQVLVDGAIRYGEDRRQLVLRGRDLVVLGLGRHAQLPQRVVELFHEVVHRRADRAKVVLLKLLTLARRRAKQRAAREYQVLALLVVLFFDEEVLLLGAHGRDDARYVDAEMRERLHRLVRDGLHAAQKRRLLVERLAGIRAKRCGDAQDLVFDESVAGRIPSRVAAGLEGGADAAAGKRRRVRLALNQLLAGEGHDGVPVAFRVEKGVVLFGGDAREGLEPVRVVGRAVFDRPLLHGVRHDVCHLDIKRQALVDGLGEDLVGGLGQALLHGVVVENERSVLFVDASHERPSLRLQVRGFGHCHSRGDLFRGVFAFVNTRRNRKRARRAADGEKGARCGVGAKIGEGGGAAPPAPARRL